MLEVISLVISLFLLTYAVRAFIFLHISRKYHLDSIHITHQSPPQSTSKTLDKSNISYSVTADQNLILHDGLKKQILERNILSYMPKLNYDEFTANFEVPESKFSVSSNRSQPVISIIVATYNEEAVIGNLLNSLEMLTYNRSRFEVIVVDDSTDSTGRILGEWAKRLENLKIIKRSKRIGWKGGALNLALKYLRKDSAWVIVLDADTILPTQIIEKFLTALYNSKKICNAIQGYCIPYNNYFRPNTGFVNWISKGVEFRLAQRNMIEFVAKDKLNLPIQITGSLFMVRSSILKEIGFPTDICEDWDLTVELYLRRCNNSSTAESEFDSPLGKTTILFDENLNAGSQMPTAFSSYFKQRLRVSEGHTRGFIKMMPRIIRQKQLLKNKVELFLTGLQYLKHVFVFTVILLDFFTGILLGSDMLNVYSLVSFLLQLLYLLSVIISNVLSVNIYSRSRQYDLSFLVSKMLLDVCTLPALIIGSLLGILRTKGTFYRTQRIASNVRYSSINEPLDNKFIR